MHTKNKAHKHTHIHTHTHTGMCFGGSETCRQSWTRNTCNLTHWLSRIFFTCSIGFILPQSMITKKAILDGWEVGSAAFFGRYTHVHRCVSNMSLYAHVCIRMYLCMYTFVNMYICLCMYKQSCIM